MFHVTKMIFWCANTVKPDMSQPCVASRLSSSGVFSVVWNFSWAEWHPSGRSVYKCDHKEHQTMSLSGCLKWHSPLRVPLLTGGYLALSSTDPSICDKGRERRGGDTWWAINNNCEHSWQIWWWAHLTQAFDSLMTFFKLWFIWGFDTRTDLVVCLLYL